MSAGEKNPLSPSPPTPPPPPPPNPPTYRLPPERTGSPLNPPRNPIRAAGSRPDTSPVHPLLLLYCIKSRLPHSHRPSRLSVPSCLSPSNRGHFVKIRQRKETENFRLFQFPALFFGWEEIHRALCNLQICQPNCYWLVMLVPWCNCWLLTVEESFWWFLSRWIDGNKL